MTTTDEHVHGGGPCPSCAIGICIPCAVGKHDECNRGESIVGCACVDPEHGNVSIEKLREAATIAMRDFG